MTALYVVREEDERRSDHASRETVRRAAKALRRGTTPRAVLGGIRAHVERELIIARARDEGVVL